MHFVVTAGPTIEPLDQVRRLTNFSTGRLGTELARHLSGQGHTVSLLLSEQAVYQGAVERLNVLPFNTTLSLLETLKALSRDRVDAVFHAAAVSDFRFGQVWQLDSNGNRLPVAGGKISTRSGKLLAELLPTPKLIAQLRGLFPNTALVGWKYEVEGDRAAVLEAALRQLRDCQTDACVANGPAYGDGFGLVLNGGPSTHVNDSPELFRALLNTALLHGKP